jgi:hypothetical protein
MEYLDLNDDKSSHKFQIPNLIYYNKNLNIIQWLYKPPYNCHIIGSVNWRYEQNENIKLSIGCSQEFIKLFSKKIPNISTKTTIPTLLLINGFKICVRKSLPIQGLHIATQLILNNKIQELLKTILTSMIEDCVLNIDFSVLLWYLLAGQANENFEYKLTHCNHILKIIESMIIGRIKDQQYKTILLKQNTKMFSLINNIQLPIYKNLLWSLASSINFSCESSGSMINTNKALGLWISRIHNNSKLLKFTELSFGGDNCTKIPSINNYLEFKTSMIPLEAIDNICSPELTKTIAKIYKLNVEFIDDLVIQFRSNINTRHEINRFKNKIKQNNKMSDFWDKISGLIDEESNKILMSYS